MIYGLLLCNLCFKVKAEVSVTVTVMSILVRSSQGHLSLYNGHWSSSSPSREEDSRLVKLYKLECAKCDFYGLVVCIHHDLTRLHYQWRHRSTGSIPGRFAHA
jgi:hypothetical protein